MPPDPPDLTDAERDMCARSGMDPERYAAVRDVETHYGGRSVPDILAALSTDDRKD